jgi:hypothetical protein
LSDLKSKLEQFAVDAWRAPKRIFDAHQSDHRAQFRLDMWPPSPSTRFPTPVAAKAGPVPTHERLGPDDCENLQDWWEPAIQLNKEPSIMVRQPDATMQPAPQYNQLMSNSPGSTTWIELLSPAKRFVPRMIGCEMPAMF